MIAVAWRFTPTRVGKTWWRGGSPPRVWGRRQVITFGNGGLGSPPRVWGRHHEQAIVVLQPRFTPTRVGKTLPAILARNALAVHPHACGEDYGPARKKAGGAGSPPRVWGRLELCSRQAGKSRFTPTRVGKTWTHRNFSRTTPVHPHACGEDVQGTTLACSVYGSPPRVWGRLRLGQREGTELRFTPTRVGKTSRSSRSSLAIAVHPHACGEDLLKMSALLAFFGSPPRVWGRRFPVDHLAQHHRFTPTRVGKTGVIVGRVH